MRRVVYAGNEHAALAEQVRERLRQQGWVPPAIQAFDGQAVDGQGIVFGRAQAFAELAAALQAAGREPYLFAASSQVAGAWRACRRSGRGGCWPIPTCPRTGPSKARQPRRAAAAPGPGPAPGVVAGQYAVRVAPASEALKQIGRDASREQLIARWKACTMCPPA
jgi:hypothetical protein